MPISRCRYQCVACDDVIRDDVIRDHVIRHGASCEDIGLVTSWSMSSKLN